MDHFYHVRGIYDHGEIRLLEKPEHLPEAKTEIEILFPNHNVKGMSPEQFSQFSDFISVGGDAVRETEELYND